MAIWGFTWACYILGCFFAIVAWRQRGHLKAFMQQIREVQVAPVAAKIQQVELDLTSIGDPNAPRLDVSDSPEQDEG